jgi:hypothetical protein
MRAEGETELRIVLFYSEEGRRVKRRGGERRCIHHVKNGRYRQGSSS